MILIEFRPLLYENHKKQLTFTDMESNEVKFTTAVKCNKHC